MNFGINGDFPNRFNRFNKVNIQTPNEKDSDITSKKNETKPVLIERNPKLIDFLNNNDRPIVIKLKRESFKNVLNEMRDNVPSRTSTIEEKELALSYIDRMLSCDDITPEMKAYWSDKKEILNAEIQSIKNSELAGTGEKWDDVLAELNEFTQNYLKNGPNYSETQANLIEYYLTYNNTCISFYQRMLECEDITNEDKSYCEKQIQMHRRDKNNQLRDLNRFRQEQGLETESFKNVLNEMRDNVPSRTSTIEEKELALSYIDRMLSCDDITPEMKAYWNRNKRIIQSEINRMK